MKYTLNRTQQNSKLIDDAIALLQLMNEHNKTNFKMRFTEAARGRANIRLQRFTIPGQAIECGESYLFYYVIHEYTHCISRIVKHNDIFKHGEIVLLRKFTNMDNIDYARAYPKKLYANGQIVYKRK